MPNIALRDVPAVQVPTPGVATFDVSKLATSGSGTWADPWTGWMAALAAVAAPNQTYFFPSGVYGQGTSTWQPILNWNNHYKGELGAIFKYTGSGRCVELIPTITTPDTGLTAFGNILENLIFDGGGTATDGMFINSVHHTTFRNLYVRNVTNIKFYFKFAVSNTLDQLHATSRVGAVDGLHEETTRALHGFYFDHDGNPSNTFQSNTVLQCEVEFTTGAGAIFAAGCQWNDFLGGVWENCIGRGIEIYGEGNTLVSMDLEATSDPNHEEIYIAASHNKLIGCIVQGVCRIGSADSNPIRHTEITAGVYGGIYIDGNAEYTRVDTPGFNFFPSSGNPTPYFVDHSSTTIIVGAPHDLETFTPRPLQAKFPGSIAVGGHLVALHGYGLCQYTPNGTLKQILIANDGSLSTQTVTPNLPLVATDNFSAASSQWTPDSMVSDYPDSLVTLALVGSQFSITLPNTTASSHFGGYGNVGHEIADGGYEYVKFIQKPAAGSYQMRFSIGKGYKNNLQFQCDGTNLIYGAISGGSFGSIASVSFNPATMIYWRFLRVGANIKAQYSADASSWTDLGTSTGAPFSFSSYHTCIEAGSTGSSTFSQAVKFDDYTYFHG